MGLSRVGHLSTLLDLYLDRSERQHSPVLHSFVFDPRLFARAPLECLAGTCRVVPSSTSGNRSLAVSTCVCLAPPSAKVRRSFGYLPSGRRVVAGASDTPNRQVYGYLAVPDTHFLAVQPRWYDCNNHSASDSNVTNNRCATERKLSAVGTCWRLKWPLDLSNCLTQAQQAHGH